MDTAPALLERSDGVATLTLNDPQRLNALTPALLGRCNEILETIRADPSVRALLIRAEGKSFCCGANLADFRAGAGGEPAAEPGVGAGAQPPAGTGTSLGDRVYALMREHADTWVMGLRALPIPVVCAVQGAVAGGGVGFALAADIVVAARSAYFYLPFVPALGLVPDMGSLRFMAGAVGEARTVGAALLGDKISAERAAQWGLVWACVDDARLAEEAMAVARRLAALPAGAVGEIRELMRLGREAGLPEQLAHERERQRALMNAPSFAEGVSAFLARRPPRFHA